MFRKKADNEEFDGAQSLGHVSTIASGMVITGDVHAEGDIRIDGKIEGNIFSKGRVVLGAAGVVDGDMNAANADVFGTVNGNVKTKDMLCLKNKSVIHGNIHVGRLHVEPNASFNGQCKMNDEHAQPNAVKEAKAILAREQHN